MLTRRLLKSRMQALLLQRQSAAMSTHPRDDPNNHIPFESNRLTDKSRFDDEPEPAEEDQIVTHYLKHHPLYEFRDFQEHHVDGYRHWLHNRIDYLGEEMHEGEISPWSYGNPAGHMFFVLLPFLSLIFVNKSYKEHLKQKNINMPIIGIFSQD